MEIKKKVNFVLNLSSAEFVAIMEVLKDSSKTYPKTSISFKECTELHKQMKMIWDEK